MGDELDVCVPWTTALELGDTTDDEVEAAEGGASPGGALPLSVRTDGAWELDTGCCEVLVGKMVVLAWFDRVPGPAPVGESLPIDATTFPACNWKRSFEVSQQPGVGRLASQQ